MTNVSETLYKAADVIAEHGWCQNNLYSNDGEVCLKGALAAAVGCYEKTLGTKRWSYVEAEGDLERGARFEEANDAVQQHLRDVGELTGYPPLAGNDTHDWNDRGTTTAEDVILVLKTVAKDHE